MIGRGEIHVEGFYCSEKNGAGGEDRTLMGVSPRDFESRASTSFTTPATEEEQFQMPKSKCQIKAKDQMLKEKTNHFFLDRSIDEKINVSS